MYLDTKSVKPKKLIVYIVVTLISILGIASLIFLGNVNRLWIWANPSESQQKVQPKNLSMINNSGILESQISGEFLLKKHSQDGMGGSLSLIINDNQKEISSDYTSFEKYKINLKKGDKIAIKISPKFDIFVKEIFSTDQDRTKIKAFDQSLRISFEDSDDGDFNDLVLDLFFPETIQSSSSFSSQQSSLYQTSKESSSLSTSSNMNSSFKSTSFSNLQSSSKSSLVNTSSSKSSKIGSSKSQSIQSSSSSNPKINEKREEGKPESMDNLPNCSNNIEGDRVYGGEGVDKMVGSRGCFFGQGGDDNYTIRPYIARTGNKEIYIFDDQGSNFIEISSDYKLISQDSNKLFLENSNYKTTVYINGKNIKVKHNNQLLITL
jgi:hypothetical protein